MKIIEFRKWFFLHIFTESMKQNSTGEEKSLLIRILKYWNNMNDNKSKNEKYIDYKIMQSRVGFEACEDELNI